MGTKASRLLFPRLVDCKTTCSVARQRGRWAPGAEPLIASPGAKSLITGFGDLGTHTIWNAVRDSASSDEFHHRLQANWLRHSALPRLCLSWPCFLRQGDIRDDPFVLHVLSTAEPAIRFETSTPVPDPDDLDIDEMLGWVRAQNGRSQRPLNPPSV